MDSANSVPPAANVGTFDHLQPALQAPQHGHPGNPLGHPQQTAPAGPLPAQWGNLPAALRDRRQWVLAGADKMPLTIDGRAASSTDPTTWADFDSVCRAAEARNLHIGYVLTEDDPFTCIDMDVKDTTPQEHIQRFHKIVEEFDSYTEHSRSGKGFHVWVEGKIGKGRRREGVEVYSQERYIICTGNVLKEKPIVAQQERLQNMISQMPETTCGAELVEVPPTDTDDGVMGRAWASGEKFQQLWQGQWEELGFSSQSEADASLIQTLAFHSPSNEQCRRLFRMSALGKREKATKNDTYLNRTLAVQRGHVTREAAAVAHGKKIADVLLANWEARRAADVFQLLTDHDLGKLPPLRWLVKGFIPVGGVGALFGASGTFKSFLALDLLAHIANGQPWFGQRVKAAPVVYVPFEGRGGIPRRVAAWRQGYQQFGATSTGISFLMEPINLRKKEDRDKLVMTLKSKITGGVLCIDTLAQAGGSFDENSSDGMGEMIAIFQELQQQLDCTVLVVHHSGKHEGAGLRGHSSLQGALDFVIKVWKKEAKSEDDDSDGPLDARFTMQKVKDGESGTEFPFTMNKLHLGNDEDGDPYTSLAVAPWREPHERKQAPDEAVQAAADDAFVNKWIRLLTSEGQRPTGRGLEAMRVEVKAEHNMTQKRLRDAIARLKDRGQLREEQGGPSGAKWLRPVDTCTVARS